MSLLQVFFKGITTDRIKLFNRPETLDLFNPVRTGYLRKWGCSFFYHT